MSKTINKLAVLAELEENIKGYEKLQAKELKDIFPNLRGLAMIWGKDITQHGKNMLNYAEQIDFQFAQHSILPLPILTESDYLQAIEWNASQIVAVASKVLADCAAIQEAIHNLKCGRQTIERLKAELQG